MPNAKLLGRRMYFGPKNAHFWHIKINVYIFAKTPAQMKTIDRPIEDDDPDRPYKYG
jgi:hypothetical protein